MLIKRSRQWPFYQYLEVQQHSFDGEAFEITETVEQLRIRYRRAGVWVDNWDSILENSMPGAVSVELTLNDGGKRYLFSAVARPPV